MKGGELALAFIAGGLGFVAADFLDRYLATYDPSATGEMPKDKFTGGNGTMANTLNVASFDITSTAGLIRLGAGIAATALPLVGAHFVKNDMGKAALHGAGIGAGIKVFSTLWNSYVMGGLLKPAAGDDIKKSLGARLYPAEITASQNLANTPKPTYAAPFAPGLAAPPVDSRGRSVPPGGLPPTEFGPHPTHHFVQPKDLGPVPTHHYLQPPPPFPYPHPHLAAPDGLAAPPLHSADVGPFALAAEAPAAAAPSPSPSPAAAPAAAPSGRLGDRLPMYLGFLDDES
jgi:hypothetical protein